MLSNLTVSVLFALAIIGGLVNPSAGAPHLTRTDCQGIDVLYPSASTVVHQSEDQTIYLILGNRIKNASLKEVSLVRNDNESNLTISVWTGDDEMSKITAVQQDLEQLGLPNHFWFRASVDQGGQSCQYESEIFELVE
ncbi:hypothetical protein CLU79DRAFT_764403 [Phycomyces nitens]|nr:hypothetical protein CLU79DRAFT_764403 [Phycomyces nitens]